MSIIGYLKHYLSLEKFLLEQTFADQIEVIGMKDERRSGNFDIFIGDDKQLVYSKRTMRQGKAETPEAREMIVEFIQEYLLSVNE